MADLDVEKKKNNDWWKWLLGIVALAIVLWLIFDTGDDDDELEEVDTTTYIESFEETEENGKTYLTSL